MDKESNHKKPLVAIRCITYNQEKYIRDALEGFVMQKTTFPFVAIVHDDASTDGTATIIREYAQKYPDIIIPIIETENQYSKHDGSLGRIMKQACENTGAKYIAMCEGDDYWTDPNKLQKQVNFLESHPEYSLCFHNAITLMMDNSCNKEIYNITGTREYTASEILEKWTIPTASVVFRRDKILTDPIRFNPRFKYGDNVLFLTAAQYGKLYGINEFMSVYRKNETSVTNSINRIKWTEINIEHFKALNESFASLLRNNLCKEIIATQYIYLIRRHRTQPISLMKYLLLAFRYCPLIFSKAAYNIWILRRN